MIDEKCLPYRELVDIIDSHPGIDKAAAQLVLTELGPNMEVCARNNDQSVKPFSAKTQSLGFSQVIHI